MLTKRNSWRGVGRVSTICWLNGSARAACSTIRRFFALSRARSGVWRDQTIILEGRIRRRMPEPVTIPISFFEITIDYEKTHVPLLADRAPLVHAIFAALLLYNAIFDYIEI